MKRKLKALRNMRSVVTSTLGKYDNRAITDCTMVSPLVNDKGVSLNANRKTKKRSLVKLGKVSINRTGIRNK